MFKGIIMSAASTLPCDKKDFEFAVIQFFDSSNLWYTLQYFYDISQFLDRPIGLQQEQYQMR